MAWQRILCPIDINDPCIETMQMASELSVNASANLYILHVVEDLVVPGMGVQLSYGNEITKTEHHNLVKKIKQLLKNLIPATPAPHIIIERGDVGRTIINEAVKRNIDLIIMTRGKRSILEDILFPSVTDTVIHKAPCPTLLMKREIHEHITAPQE